MAAQEEFASDSLDQLAQYCARNMGLDPECASQLRPLISDLLSVAGSPVPSDSRVYMELCVWLALGSNQRPFPTSVDDGIRDAAVKVLMRTIFTIARPVARGSYQKGLIDDAVQHVVVQVLEGKYKIGKFSFRRWARVVIRNFLNDHKPPVVPPDADQEDACPDETVRPTLLTELFPDRDTERIRQWEPVRDRIVVLVCYGLRYKVADEEWDAWCRTAGLDPAGPKGGYPVGYERARRDEIAEWAGMTRAALDQVICRKRHWLWQLESIRDARDALSKG